jgi:hypothetical protein
LPLAGAGPTPRLPSVALQSQLPPALPLPSPLPLPFASPGGGPSLTTTISSGSAGASSAILTTLLAAAALAGWRALRRSAATIPVGIVLSSPAPPG